MIEKILNTHNIAFSDIVKSNVGFTNDVYIVDKKYIVKISRNKDKNYKLQKEINIYKHLEKNYIPKMYFYGEIDGFTYLVLEYIDGVNLYSVWDSLKDKERNDITIKICDIINDFHTINYSFLGDCKWSDFMLKTLDINVKALDNVFTDDEIETAKKLFTDIFSQEKIVLCHNDFHFDNFLMCNNNLYLIDFDRVLVGSADYDMLILGYMCDNPKKFASEEDESKVIEKNYNIVPLIKKYCPQMFDFKDIDRRVKIYRFFYNIKQYFESGKVDKEKLKNDFRNLLAL